MHDQPLVVALFQYERSLPLRRHRLAIHGSREVPLVARPRERATYLDIRIGTNETYVLRARALLLVQDHVVAPTDHWGTLDSADEHGVIRVGLVEAFDVANLPRTQQA